MLQSLFTVCSEGYGQSNLWPSKWHETAAEIDLSGTKSIRDQCKLASKPLWKRRHPKTEPHAPSHTITSPQNSFRCFICAPHSALLSRWEIWSHPPITLIIRCPPRGDRWHHDGDASATARYKLIRETALASRCDRRAEKIGQSYESTSKHINLIQIRMRAKDGTQLLMRWF